MSSLKPFGDTLAGKIGEFIYSGITAIRNSYYDRRKAPALPFPVISIGGISAGGTGKTPLTGMVVEYLISQGYTPILFSRGYGRESKECLIVSADGSSPKWNEVGDEPAMLRNRNPQLWLAINGDRMEAVERLIPQLPRRAVAVMDDGFQHRKMPRDLDIVTLPPTVLEDYVIPRGLLREPLRSLSRANIITVMGEFCDEGFAKLKSWSGDKPMGTLITEPDCFVNPEQQRELPDLNEPVVLFSGIARPERFKHSVEQCDVRVENVHTFPDHHVYSDLDFDMLKSDSERPICTTEKDWIRSVGNKSVNRENLWYLRIKQRFTDEHFRKRFFDLIDNCLENSNDRSYC